MSPLDQIKLRLLLGRTWRYLRYMHLRQAVLAARPRSILAVGAGQGLAELAIAVEFPEIDVLVTDVKGARTPNYRIAVALAEQFKAGNIRFDLCDILRPTTFRADLVCSVEVLEHIEDDERAAAGMREAGRRVFCLVPFADAATNADPARRRKAWERHEHFVVGYEAQTLSALFGEPIVIRGCYWSDAGAVLRGKLTDSTDDAIRAQAPALFELAQSDLRDAVPVGPEDASGIWGLF